MTSELSFASIYNSSWKALIPNSERFVRRLNLNLQRFSVPIAATSTPDRRAFINEVSFRLFGQTYPKRFPLDTKVGSYAELADEVRLYLGRFADVTSPIADLSESEFEEARQLSRGLWSFVSETEVFGNPVVVNPEFPGCGIIDRCAGDILIGNCLTEVKAGDRSFRAVDIRQLIIYCALNSVAPNYDIKRVCCVNPRRGTFFILDLNILSLEVASKSAAELLAEVVYLISSGDISR